MTARLSLVARRGTSKRYSVDHEEFIAETYGGERSPSSGGAESDAGDVRTSTELIECKVKPPPAEHSLRPPTRPGVVRDFEKIAEEAYAEGREPVLALRFHDPKSILADDDGWIDLTVRRTCEDVERG